MVIRSTRLPILGITAILAAAALGGCRRSTASEPNAAHRSATINEARSHASRDFERAFISAAQMVNPMVVQVLTERMVPAQTAWWSPFQESPFEGSPFEDLIPQGPRTPPGMRRHEFRSLGLGSGVMVRPDGYVVTNNHVVREADQLKVQLSGGRRLDARVIGTDRFSDLAVIKLDLQNAPAISLADSDSLTVGQWVLAIGSPLSTDLINTVTAGIVSAVGRLSPTVASAAGIPFSPLCRAATMGASSISGREQPR